MRKKVIGLSADVTKTLRLVERFTGARDPRATAEHAANAVLELADVPFAAAYLAQGSDSLLLAHVAGSNRARFPGRSSLALRALAARDTVSATPDELSEFGTLGGAIREAVAAACVADGKVVGVLIAARKDSTQPIDGALLSAVASVAAAALASTRRLSPMSDDASSDALTGLPNHRAFHETLDRLLRESFKSRQEIALVLLDLDDLKQFNDAQGYRAGDSVLSEVARAATRVLSGTEKLFRVGGDDFAVVVSGGVEAALRAGQRLRQALSGGFGPTLSGGVAAFPADALTKDGLLHKADVALYAAKRAGKNSVLAYATDIRGGAALAKDEVTREAIRQRMKIEPIRAVVLADFAAVGDAVRRLAREETPAGVLATAARELTAVLGATACAVSQVRADVLNEVASYWPPPFDQGPTFADYAYLLADYPLTREVIDTETPRAVSLSDDETDPSEVFVLSELGMHAVLMLPVVVSGRAWGVVEVYDAGPRRFSDKDASLAGLVASEVGALLTRFEHEDSIQRLYRESLASLANALELKDRYTSSHAQEVVELSLLLARRLGLTTEELRAVELGALLHDIGKIRIPESILTKPEPLTEEEWRLMRQHTEAGEAILAPIGSLRDVLPIVRSSHERWDGNGYPDGLRGERIPLGARIVSVCDAFRAMVERRPYRPALSPAEAVRELRERSGTQFDPACVETLLDILREREHEEERPLHRPSGTISA
jgi:diguanylate cyclase (GGDEF)-like protein/putative nucleotidyltransferase with HDIG domain